MNFIVIYNAALLVSEESLPEDAILTFITLPSSNSDGEIEPSQFAQQNEQASHEEQ